MADRIQIQCPGCSAKLAISDESKLGKKIRCSKCSEVFVAKALKASGSAGTKPKPKPKKSDDDEFNFDDMEMEDKSEIEDEESEPESRPVRSKVGAKGKGKAKGKKKSSGGNLPLIIGGVVAVVLLLGVGGYFLFSGGGPAPVPVQPAAQQPVAAQPNATAQSPNPASPNPTVPNPSVTPLSTTNTSNTPPLSSAQDLHTKRAIARKAGAEQAGESVEVLAKNVNDLPSGIQKLAVTSAWGDSAKSIWLKFELQATFLEKACDFGHLEITTLTSSDGPLQIDRLGRKPMCDLLSLYQPYLVGKHLWQDQAPGWLEMSMPVRVMRPEFGSELPLLEGTFKVKTAQKVEDIVIPDVRAVANRPLEHPSLKSAEVTLSLKKEPHPLGGMKDVVRMTVGPNYAVGRAFTIDERIGAQGLSELTLDTDMGDRHFRTTRSELEDSAKLKMEFKLYSEIEEITIPFRFENVPLPNPDKRPKK